MFLSRRIPVTIIDSFQADRVHNGCKRWPQFPQVSHDLKPVRGQQMNTGRGPDLMRQSPDAIGVARSEHTPSKSGFDSVCGFFLVRVGIKARPSP
jgi:hypothetical protein